MLMHMTYESFHMMLTCDLMIAGNSFGGNFWT